MLRFFGAAFVSCAVLVGGLLLENAEMKKIRCREAFLSLLNYIKNMVNARIPPERILENFSDKELERCGFQKELRDHGVKALCILKENGSGERMGLSAREADILCEFACAFSRCPTYGDCAAMCEKYASVYGFLISEKSPKQKSMAELYRKLGVISSAAVFVILI
ncbi:MAG: hypothetical protein IKV97_07215 [Clostridia bacterium]|nr:hypothetical protein [Clostridia bacterium]